MEPDFWKWRFSSLALRQRKLHVKLKIEALCQQRDKDYMTSYCGRLDVFDTRVKSDEYASLGTSFTNLFGVSSPSSNNEVSFAAQDARVNLVTTTHLWSKQRSSSPNTARDRCISVSSVVHA